MTDVLILSSLYDLAADMVAARLEAAGASYVRLNHQELPEHRVTVDPSDPSMAIRGPVGNHVVEELGAVWFRVPIFHRNVPGRAMPIDEQLARSQWMAFLKSLSIFKDARWMNSPSATYLAESKPYQLSVAKSVGFQIPRTLVTNDVESIYDHLDDELVIKSLDTVLLREADNSLFTYTTPIVRSQLSDSNMAAAPVIAQDILKNKTDWRVTVVCDQVFSVRILENSAGVQGDWRTVPKERLSYESCQLPTSDQRKCLELTKQLGLSFGAIDLIENRDGLFFIEINPTGEWSWLVASSRPIDFAIAAWLKRGAKCL